jgi:hypothetical protein
MRMHLARTNSLLIVYVFSSSICALYWVTLDTRANKYCTQISPALRLTYVDRNGLICEGYGASWGPAFTTLFEALKLFLTNYGGGFQDSVNVSESIRYSATRSQISRARALTSFLTFSARKNGKCVVLSLFVKGVQIV